MGIGADTFSGHDDHAERMDRMYRYQRHVYDLTRKYYLLGRDRAIAGLALEANQTLLEIGCGTGRNLVLANRRYPQARLHGLDISAEMLASARTSLRTVSPEVVLRVGDASDFRAEDFGMRSFDRILISYALSMIPEWERAIDCALAALAPGGSLHIVDFGQGEQLPSWFRAALRGWLARFHVTPRAALHRALQDRALAANAEITFRRIGRGYAWWAIITRPA
jgi:S-adenosylmethionine-diacylgycerolhomoserine-N-methlytransferase